MVKSADSPFILAPYPHRRGNRKHRIAHKAAYDAGQSPFHSGYSHHTIRALYHIQPGHQPVDSAHSHIINTIHIGAEEFRCLSGLFRYRYICRPCRTYRYLPDSLLSLFFNLNDMGNFIILNLGGIPFSTVHTDAGRPLSPGLLPLPHRAS